MSRFNEMGIPSPAPDRQPTVRPPVVRAIAAAVLCVVLMSTMGRTLAAGAGLMKRYAGLALTELICVAAPAVWLAHVPRPRDGHEERLPGR